MTSIGDVPLPYIDDTTEQRSPHGSSLLIHYQGTSDTYSGFFSAALIRCPGVILGHIVKGSLSKEYDVSLFAHIN